jgi:hypothetical protein
MLFSRNQVLLAKIETLRGSDSSPVGADAVLCGEVYPTIDGNELSRISVRDSISALQKKYAKKKVTFSIAVELKGSGAAGTAPEWAPLVRACGNKEVVSAGVDCQYSPENQDADMDSVTIYLYKDGRVWKAVGCLGNMSINMNAGEYPIATFSMVGKLSTVADATNPTPTYDSGDPIQIQNLGFSFGSWNDAVMRNFTFATGNTIGDRDDVNSADGYKGPFISARDPVWSARIEAVLEATNSFFADFLASDTSVFDISHGSVAGNIVEFDAPKAGYMAPVPSSESSLEMYDLSGQLLENVSEDNWLLTVK